MYCYPCQVVIKLMHIVQSFDFRNERLMLWHRLLLFIPMTIQYNVFARMVTLGVVILPVIRGDLIRPQFIFPAIPLIKLFIGSVVLRMVMDQVYRLSEMFVAARRIEVYIHVVNVDRS